MEIHYNHSCKFMSILQHELPNLIFSKWHKNKKAMANTI
jgi:hypothetical protein